MELGHHTHFEILSQPDAWAKTLESVETRAADLRDFFRVYAGSRFLQKALQPGLPTLFAHAWQHRLTMSLDPGSDPEEQWEKAHCSRC